MMNKTSALPTPEEIIRLYHLAPHPEGGFYKQTYRSQEKIGNRFCSTAIYYLLQQGQKSMLHRIKSDEMWHFYLGDPLTLVAIDENGSPYSVTLGQDIKAGELLQYTVPKNHWFGACPNPESSFSFVGCTVSPGFDFEDFEIGNKQQLLVLYPKAADIINQFL
jgi:predicted cupin superfamily sugar epimerase